MQSGGSGAHPGTSPRQRARCSAPAVRVLGAALVVVHLGLVAWFALRPRTVAWVYDANLTPFASLRHDLDDGLWAAVRTIGGQVALLAPLGVLLPMLTARLASSWIGSFLRTAAATCLLAFGLAAAQSSVPGRMFNVDDVLLGTAGAGMLHLAVVPAARARLRRRRRERERVREERAPNRPSRTWPRHSFELVAAPGPKPAAVPRQK